MRNMLNLFLLLCSLLSINSIAADFVVDENWTVREQAAWNTVVTIRAEGELEFSEVLFNIWPATDRIANKFNDTEVSWGLGMSSPSYCGFKVAGVAPELKKELEERIANFNAQEKIEMANKYAEKLTKMIIVPEFIPIIRPSPTKRENDIAFLMDLDLLNNAKSFLEIQNIFMSDKAIDKVIIFGLRKIYDKWVSK